MVRLRILEISEGQGHIKYWLYKRMDMLSYRNFQNIIENKTISIRFETTIVDHFPSSLSYIHRHVPLTYSA